MQHSHHRTGRTRSQRHALRPPRSAVLALAAAALTAAACSDRAPRARAHDVVLIVVEGLRADRLSLHGASEQRLPALERFARDGVVHARATSPATSCVPAHASLLTGRWPSYHGAEGVGDGESLRGRPIDADAPTLAEVLAAAGFRTAAFVGNGDRLQREDGFSRGFQEFDTEPERTAPARLGGVVAAWLARHPERSFLFVGVADGARLAEHRDAVAPRAGRGAAAISAAEIAAARERHDRWAVAADRSVGGVLEALRAAGRYEDALVVVTADHGELLGEHGLVGHGRPPFEPVVHVPLLVKYPGDDRGGEWVDRRVSTVAVFATVLEAVGAAPPPGTQARPLDLLHPVWVEDVDPSGARLRAGYDGADVKLMSVSGEAGELSCIYLLSHDPDETRPNCDAAEPSPLRAALASFSRRDRPPRAPIVRAPAPQASAGPDVARADR